MSQHIATVRACSNIAFIKYWGKQDASVNWPLNDSLSMCLSEASTTTTVEWVPDGGEDEIWFNGERLTDHRALRISHHLDRLRASWYPWAARVATRNTFPAGTGIASSASGFAALTAAGVHAFGEWVPDDTELSRLARQGSGSACRSIHAGFVEWRAGETPEQSEAAQVMAPEAWDLRDIVVLVSGQPKEISSTSGHTLAEQHPFMAVRQGLLPQRTLSVKAAMLRKDFETFGSLVEHEALEVQGIMMSSMPSALYMSGRTVDLIHTVRTWRAAGLPAYITLDAGPNVHILVEGTHAAEVERRLRALDPRIKLLHNRPGPGITRLDEHLL